MKRKAGFTLIELLVVIAIISILAGIVVPRVATFIARGRMARAVSEIRGAEMAITKMLTDVDKKDMRQFFTEDCLTQYNTLTLADQVYVCTYVSYKLLRLGREAADDATGAEVDWNTWTFDNGDTLDLRLKTDVVRKLGVNYVEELALDPWGNQYQFWFGPWRNAGMAEDPKAGILFRAYRPGTGSISDGSYTAYVYDTDAKDDAEEVVPGAPGADDKYGFPAPTKNEIYIFSKGANLVEDQPVQIDGSTADPEDEEFQGGGDDINNWDSEAGWARFYS